MTMKTPRLGLFTPSGAITYEDWNLCLDFFKKKKIPIFYSKESPKKNFIFAGTLAEKKKQIKEILPKTDFLIAARGGSGSIHLLDFLAKEWQKKKFSVVGFSDVSIILNFLADRFEETTIHSYTANALRKTKKENQDLFFKRLAGDWEGELAGDNASYLLYFNQQPRVIAKLFGGNLASLVSLLGTPYQIPFENRILFVEDINEPYYRIERYFASLYYAGCLEKICGLVLGGFLWENKKLENKKILQLIQNFLPPNLPIIANFPSGHQENNYPLPIGAEVILDTKKKNFVKN